MNKTEQEHYESLYEQHVNALKRQGKSKSTVDAHALRRITAFFDHCPDTLSVDDLKTFFSSRVETRSWSTVKIDRNGLQFFYKHVLGKKWEWVDIVKPPTIKRLPDILIPAEISHLIKASAPRQLLLRCSTCAHPCACAYAPYLHPCRQQHATGTLSNLHLDCLQYGLTPGRSPKYEDRGYRFPDDAGSSSRSKRQKRPLCHVTRGHLTSVEKVLAYAA